MAKKEHLATLREGVAAWNEWRAEDRTLWPDLIRANLPGLELDGINFENVNLLGANLEASSLCGSRLRNANLKDTKLSEARFRKSILVEANLYNSDLREADLSDASLRYANLTQATLDGTLLERVIMGFTTIGKTSLAGISGLASVIHQAASNLDVNTIETSVRMIRNLPSPQERLEEFKIFCINAGLPEHLLRHYFGHQRLVRHAAPTTLAQENKVPSSSREKISNPCVGSVATEVEKHHLRTSPASQLDFELIIREVPNGRLPTYFLELHSPDLDLGIHHRTFGPIQLKSDASQYFIDLFKKIQALPVDAPSSARDLEDLGSTLYQELVPHELGNLLSRFTGDQSRVKTLLLQSDEPWIPWEIIRLPRVDARAPFLCEAFATSRWLEGTSPCSSLPIRHVAVVAPTDSGLPYANREMDWLLELADSKRQIDPIDPHKENVLEELSSSKYDGWHFSGHGLPADEPNSSEILLQNYETLTPQNLMGDARDLGRNRPLVFLNGCHTGRGDMSLTGIGGWAKAFLGAGAGAFVGAYWAIEDERASDFAHVFYKLFLSGLSIAEAARQARLSIRVNGDPTWLAYTVYAYPLAFCPAS